MLAVRHLVELGHHRIAFITGSENHPDAIERLNGYKKALQDAGIDFDPRLVAVGDWHDEGGLRATLGLLESKVKFTALFCVNDQTAYGACLALFRKNLSVPGDVSIVGAGGAASALLSARRTAIALSSLRRCPTISTPRSFKSSPVKVGRMAPSISLLWNSR